MTLDLYFLQFFMTLFTLKQQHLKKKVFNFTFNVKHISPLKLCFVRKEIWACIEYVKLMHNRFWKIPVCR